LNLNVLRGFTENRIDCFFWCTANGLLPEEVDEEDSQEAQEALDEAVRLPCSNYAI